MDRRSREHDAHDLEDAEKHDEQRPDPCTLFMDIGRDRLLVSLPDQRHEPRKAVLQKDPQKDSRQQHHGAHSEDLYYTVFPMLQVHSFQTPLLLIIAAVLHLIPISLIIRGEESLLLLLLWIFILKNQ